MKLIPYLMFREGKCREAFAFYAHALGGEIVSIATYGEMGPDIPEPMRPFIANIQLLGGGTITAIADPVPACLDRAERAIGHGVARFPDAATLAAMEAR